MSELNATLQRYAQLSGQAGDAVRTIVLVIEAEADPDGTNGQWVLCGDHGPGSTTTDNGLTFVEPEAAAPARTLSKLQFLRLLTQAERIAFRQAAKVNPVMEDFLALLDLADHVDKDDPDVVAGLYSAEEAGVLAPGRAAEILG